MIEFDECLEVGKKAKRHQKRIISKLNKGKPVPGVWLLTNPMNTENLYDIFDAKLLVFPYYKKMDIHVYGIAKSRDEAIELLLGVLEKKI